jgi:hypothetical protein
MNSITLDLIIIELFNKTWGDFWISKVLRAKKKPRLDCWHWHGIAADSGAILY